MEKITNQMTTIQERKQHWCINIFMEKITNQMTTIQERKQHWCIQQSSNIDKLLSSFTSIIGAKALNTNVCLRLHTFVPGDHTEEEPSTQHLPDNFLSPPLSNPTHLLVQVPFVFDYW
jgi:hypothetical protein